MTAGALSGAMRQLNDVVVPVASVARTTPLAPGRRPFGPLTDRLAGTGLTPTSAVSLVARPRASVAVATMTSCDTPGIGQVATVSVEPGGS